MKHEETLIEVLALIAGAVLMTIPSSHIESRDRMGEALADIMTKFREEVSHND